MKPRLTSDQKERIRRKAHSYWFVLFAATGVLIGLAVIILIKLYAEWLTTR